MRYCTAGEPAGKPCHMPATGTAEWKAFRGFPAEDQPLCKDHFELAKSINEDTRALVLTPTEDGR